RFPQGVALLGEVESLEQLLGARRPRAPDATAARDEDHMLPDGEHVVNLGGLLDQRHGAGSLGTKRVALPGDPSGVGPKESSQAEEGGGLPAPLGPRRARICPGCTCIESLSTATTDPKR